MSVPEGKFTTDLIDLAERFAEALRTGDVPWTLKAHDLYGVMASAFGVTREEAKERFIRAAYGGKAGQIP